MVKKSFISVISHEEKEENRGSVPFQILSLINGIQNFLHIWNCIEKTIYLREASVKFWENAKGCCLICQRTIEYVIKN